MVRRELRELKAVLKSELEGVSGELTEIRDKLRSRTKKRKGKQTRSVQEEEKMWWGVRKS